jgi:hypothetical protein
MEKVINRELKMFGDLRSVTEAVVSESGAAVFYAVALDWILEWRDFCEKKAKRPGRIINVPLMGTIQEARK